MARNGTRKPITASFAAVATALILVSVWVGGILESPKAAMAADPPKPAKKDSRAFIKSKNATFTTSVEPAEARPGDTITFKVTAKLRPAFTSTSSRRDPEVLARPTRPSTFSIQRV